MKVEQPWHNSSNGIFENSIHKRLGPPPMTPNIPDDMVERATKEWFSCHKAGGSASECWRAALTEVVMAEREAFLAALDDTSTIEAAARSMYQSKKWDDQKEGPGEKMKDVWRDYAKRAFAAIRSEQEQLK